MRILWIFCACSLLSCSAAILPTDKNTYLLPTYRGQVRYSKTEVKKGIKFDEFYRVARMWVRENKVYYGLQWERPISKATLLHSGIIPPSRIQDDSSDYNSNIRVDYYLTVIAKDDTCKIVASTFQIEGLRQRPLFLEQTADNKILCQSVNWEMNELVNSLGTYISKNAEKHD